MSALVPAILPGRERHPGQGYGCTGKNRDIYELI